NMSKSTFFREAPTVLVNTPLNSGVTVTYDNTSGAVPTIASNVNLNDPNIGWTWAGGRVNIQNEHRVTKTKGAHIDSTFGDDSALSMRVGAAYDEAHRSIIAYDNSSAWQANVCGAPCAGTAGVVTNSALASYLKPGPGGFVTVDFKRFADATNYD